MPSPTSYATTLTAAERAIQALVAEATAKQLRSRRKLADVDPYERAYARLWSDAFLAQRRAVVSALRGHRITDWRSAALVDAAVEGAQRQTQADLVAATEAAYLAAIEAGAYRAGVELGTGPAVGTRRGEALKLQLPPGPGDVPLDDLGHAVLGGTNFAVAASPASVNWARANAAKLVAQVDDTTRRRMRTLVADGINRGQSSEVIGKRISGSFQGWAGGGGKRPQLHIDSRAHGIAVTEMTSAYERGGRLFASELKSAGQSIGMVVEKAWLTVGDARVDADCGDAEAQGWVETDAPFDIGVGEPPAHPYCRCTLEYRTRLPQGQAPKDYAAMSRQDILDELNATTSTRATAQRVMEDRYGLQLVVDEGWGASKAHYRGIINVMEDYADRGIDWRVFANSRNSRFDTLRLTNEARPGAAGWYDSVDRTIRIPRDTAQYLGHHGYQNGRIQQLRAGMQSVDSFTEVITHELGHALDFQAWYTWGAAAGNTQGAAGQAWKRWWTTQHQASLSRQGGAHLDELRAQMTTTREFIKDAEQKLASWTDDLARARQGLPTFDGEVLSDVSIQRLEQRIGMKRLELDMHRTQEKLIQEAGEAAMDADLLPSGYAATNEREDAAEAFTHWLHAKDDFAAVAPRRVDKIDELLAAWRSGGIT